MANDAQQSDSKRSTQFSLRYILSVTAIAAIASLPLAARQGFSIPLSVWLFALGVAVLHKRLQVIGGLVVILVAVLLILPAVGGAGPAARRNGCANNIRQIALAVLNYEAAKGHFPPPYTTDEDGNPLHSWRILILPYLEEPDLYDDIDLEKPWHHPDNLALADRMPGVFCCPAERDISPKSEQTTAYVAIVGDRTIWRRNQPTCLTDITDGTSQTLLLLESEVHRLHWMSTADPSFEMIGPRNSHGDTLLSNSPHPRVSIAAFCDSHVSMLPNNEPFTNIQAMATIAGKETLTQPQPAE